MLHEEIERTIRKDEIAHPGTIDERSRFQRVHIKSLDIDQ